MSKIKAADILTEQAVPRLQEYNTALKQQLDKLVYYIKPLLKAAQIPSEDQQKITAVLTALTNAQNEISSQLTSLPASKWEYVIKLLGNFVNVADSLIREYDSVLPNNPLKAVYRNMVVPNIETLINSAENFQGLVRQEYQQVADKNKTPETTEVKEEPKEEKKEEPKKEEPKEGPTEGEPKEVKEEGPTEGGPKEEKEKSKSWEPFKEEFDKKELKEISQKTNRFIKDAITSIGDLVSDDLKNMPNPETFTEANKLKDVKKYLAALHSEIRALYKESPEYRLDLAEQLDPALDQVDKLFDLLNKTVPNPRKRIEHTRNLVKIKNNLQDAKQMLTFGNTFKRAYKNASIEKVADSDINELKQSIENLNILYFDDQTDIHVPLSYLVVAEDQLGNAAIGIYPETAFDPNVVDDLIKIVEEANPEAKVEAPMIKTVETETLL